MPSNLKIIIPVAGVGTRLRPHTYTVPKPLLPVAGKEMLAHVIDPLLCLNPEEVIFVVGYLGDQIVSYIRHKYDFKATFVEQKELLGLGYAVGLALREITPGPAMVVLGDTIARTNYEDFITAGDTIAVKKVRDPRRFGIVVVDNGRIIEFEEKPQQPRSDLAIIGLYYFRDSDILKKYVDKLISSGKTTRGEIQLTDALDLMVRDGHHFRPFEVSGWFDCGKKETLLATNRELLEDNSETADYPGSIIIPPVYIAPSASIEDAVIGPNVTIMDDSIIKRSIIRNSIVSAQTSVEDSLLEDSLVGFKAVVRGHFRSINVGDSSEV